MSQKLNNGSNVFVGNKINAVYTPSDEAMYRHNAFIETLPQFDSVEQICKLIWRKPAYSEADRLKIPQKRLLLVQTISNFVAPSPNIIDLAHRIERLIRNGYVCRNPIDAEWIKQIRAGFPELDWGSEIPGYKPLIRSSASGFCIIGTSGVGKSTGTECGLGLFPQVIIHTKYNGHELNRVQLVWLKLECPQDGSLKGLCLNFFQAVDLVLDTRYYEKFANGRRTLDELLPIISKIAASVGLGVLVIDEIQRLNDAKSGGAQRMLNFFVQLVNTIGVPVILVGTFKALGLLNKEFAMARRSAGQGDFIWSNESQDEVWDYFIENLWTYQWTDTYSPLTLKIKQAIYEESQGIVDIAVKLYQLAQWDVIGTEDEKIIPGLIHKVAVESLRISKPIIDALKRKDIKTLRLINDVHPAIESLHDFFRRAEERVTTSGVLNTVGNQQLGSKKSLEDEEAPLFIIAKWLVEGGIEPKIAKESAKQAIDRYSSESDFKMAMHLAYQIALNLSTNQNSETKSKIKVENKVYSSPDLRGIWLQGNQSGQSGYNNLKNAGLIKPALEFL